MDYKKLYKEAIKRAKSWAKGEHPECFSEAQKAVDFIFPELKESDDEKIRKAIHIYLDWLDGRNKDYQPKGDYTIRDMIDWLVKQSEQSHWKPTEEQLQTLHAQLNEGAVTYPDDKRVLTTLYEDLMKITTQEEKQVEQKESLCDKCKIELPSHFGHDIISLGRWALKHQSKQESNKVEPKFKVGDWVINDKLGGIYHIESVEDGFYNHDFGSFTFDNEPDCRIWTIQDAKAGDVLSSKHGDDILIFRNLDTSTSFLSYFNIAGKGDFGWANDCFIPATKEQRDLLFQEMKKEGYEWDADKKELKEIEPNHINEVKPKFNVGDWIVYEGLGTYKVVEIHEGWYSVIDSNDRRWSVMFENEKIRMWTIQDAKEGDVLINKTNDAILIFKTIQDNYRFSSYCDYFVNTFREKQFSQWSSSTFIPATKEQRELLFNKMKESGYKWDAEKKELKKIEQKSNKVEPKFKVGDFIADGYCRGKIVIITDDAYLLDTGQGIPFSCEHNAHLWTIQDAKSGDVLASHECYVIFKEIDGSNIKCYCTYHYIGFNPSFYVDTLQNKNAFYPSTKEQRDILFQKMKESGYEWDANKKELKKIEQKPTNIEPKFKIGDWLSKQYLSTPFVIVDIKDNLYILIDTEGNKYKECINFVHDRFHLWTIEDAEDGDVLVESNCNAIIMFRGVGNIKWDDVIDYHCYYDCHRENFIVQEGGSHWGNTEDCTLSPATKEQREFLFSKMKESGYEWDKEELELKKIEPNFKVEKCKWYVCTKTFVLRDKIVVLKGQTYKSNQNGAIEGENKCLFIDTHDGKASDYFRPWTIEDAEDGDVLIYVDGFKRDWVFIYNKCNGFDISHINDDNYVINHYCLVRCDNFYPKGGIKIDIEYVNPATKEQRKLLFQKIKESGYEWDADKKELKKIEDDKVKSTEHSYITTNSEFFQWIYDRLKYVYNENPNVDYMLSLKERIENMQKPSWNEEDEKCLSFMIDCLETCSMGKQLSFLHSTALKYIDWLKSLKNRI